MENLFGNKRQTQKQLQQQQPQPQKQSDNNYGDPTDIRSLLAFVKLRTDSIQPKIWELQDKNWRRRKLPWRQSKPEELEMARSFCYTTKLWKEKEIKDHLQSHREVKLLNEGVLAARQKRRELIANANAVNQKL